jgi:hypothetical protein
MSRTRDERASYTNIVIRRRATTTPASQGAARAETTQQPPYTEFLPTAEGARSA